jgi:hypothetical protein
MADAPGLHDHFISLVNYEIFMLLRVISPFSVDSLIRDEGADRFN